MTGFGVKILDSGSGFTIVTADMEVDFKYGDFALCMADTDAFVLREILYEALHSSAFQNLKAIWETGGFYDDMRGTEYGEWHLDLALMPVKAYFMENVGYGYLDSNQQAVLSLLLYIEVMDSLIHGNMDTGNPFQYLPSVFSNIYLLRHVRDMLQNKKHISTDAQKRIFDDMQDKVTDIPLTSSVIITDNGTAMTAYELDSTLSYLVLDMQRYMAVQPKPHLNECQLCRRLFYPSRRQDEKYCKLPHKDTDKLCAEIRHREQDAFQKAVTKARAYQHQQIFRERTKITSPVYDDKFQRGLYEKWAKECSEKYDEYVALNDLAGFIQWINSEKYTAKRIAEEWEQYKASKGQRKKK